MDNLAESEQATPAGSDLTSLPPEILRRIVVTRLDIRDRFRAAAVCRMLRMVLNDPTAWADVERIHLNVLRYKHFVDVYGADGYRLGSWSLTSSPIPELLKRSHPKQLDIKEHSQAAIPSLIREILSFLPSTLEHVRLCVYRFEDDYQPLLQRLAPSLKRLGINARSYDKLVLGSPSDFTELECLEIEGSWKPGALQGCHDAASWLFLEQVPNLRQLRLMPKVPFTGPHLGPERDVYVSEQAVYRRIASALNERITPVTELCMDANFVLHITNGLSLKARSAIETLCVPSLPSRYYLYGGGEELVSTLPSWLPGLRRLSLWHLPTQDMRTLREAFFAEHNASTDADRRLTIESDNAAGLGVTTHETRGRFTVTVKRGRRQCAHNTLGDDMYW